MNAIRNDLAVQTNGIGRIYRVKKTRRSPAKELEALGSIDLEIRKGELFGLLGPNGAGKTTLIKILTTLLAPTSGVAYVDGLDVVKQARQLRYRINMVSGGETSGFGILTVRENLWMFSQFYGVPSKEAYAKTDYMLRTVGLEDKANARVSSLSTGQRQRMNFCRGFITDPKVIFLDEPTLGLDVTAARQVRDFTQLYMRENPERTVLLTTHYMAEADELCDRIAIIDRGKVLACDTPQNLKLMLQKQPVFEIGARGLDDEKIRTLEQTNGIVRITATPAEDGTTHFLKVILEEESAIGELVLGLTRVKGEIVSLQKNEPTLEDVFIKLVGRGLNDASGGEDDAA